MKSQEITTYQHNSIKPSVNKKDYQMILLNKIVTMAVIKNDLCMMLKDYKKVEIDPILNN